MEIGSILWVAKRWWWALILAMLVAGFAGYVIAAQTQQPYEARVRLQVGPITADQGTLRAADLLTRSYLELVTSQAVVEDTIAQLALPYHPDELRGLVRPTADGASRTMIIRVRDMDPDRTVAIANALSEQLIALTSQGAPSPEAETIGQLRILDPAVSAVPLATRTTLFVVLAMFAGGIAHLAFVLVFEYFNERVRSEQELVALTHADFLGEIPKGGILRRFGALAVESESTSPRAAAYRVLAMKIKLATGERPIRRLLVIGAKHTTGSGELAANLAVVLAGFNQRVTLVDANGDSAEISTLLGFRERPGLVELLHRGEDSSTGPRSLAGYRYRWSPNLSVVPLGRSSMAHVVEPAPEPWLLDALSDSTDLLVVNAPPIEQSASGLMWARAVDATVLFVRRDQTRPSDVKHIAQSLPLVGANLIGTVFEDRRSSWRDRRSNPSPPRSRSSAGYPPADDRVPPLARQ